MTLRLAGSTSGYTEIDASAVAGSNTLVLPTGYGTADQVLATNGSGALSWASRNRMVLATAQNTTSGTNIDFTGIPSWVKRITVIFNGVSTNGSSVLLMQLGSGSVSTTGYFSTATSTSGGGTVVTTSTTGLAVSGNNNSGFGQVGSVVITNVSSTTWIAFGSGLQSAAQTCTNGGSVTLSGALSQLRLTTVDGTDTFDAGSVNILYEG